MCGRGDDGYLLCLAAEQLRQQLVRLGDCICLLSYSCIPAAWCNKAQHTSDWTWHVSRQLGSPAHPGLQVEVVVLGLECGTIGRGAA